MNDNDTRRNVFLTLVTEDATMSPAEIGAEVAESRQNVKYHLDALTEQGLVIHDSEAYRCQPVFTDDEFERLFVDKLADLVPAITERIELEDEVPGEAQTAVVFNVLRMFVALEVLDQSVSEGEDDP